MLAATKGAAKLVPRSLSHLPPGTAPSPAPTQSVRPEDAPSAIPCGDDPQAVVDAVREFTDAGFTDVALVQIGGEHQAGFLEWSEKELLPALREL